MFDPPFSPHQLFLNCPYPPPAGSPCLTLNFFCALSIGYCFAYFLLVFSRKPLPTRRDPKPLPVLPRSIMWVCPVIIAGVFMCSLLAVGTLVYMNQPAIKEVNNDTLSKFARFTTGNLPKNGAILLCDSDSPGRNQPLRALLIQAAVAREGRTRDFPLLDTQSLNWAPYHRFIHKLYPEKLPLIVQSTNMGTVNPLDLFGMISSLAKSNAVCYLHPSYGYYFEKFYLEPHGLEYSMRTLPEETILPPPLDNDLVTENEIFWDKVVDSLDASVQKAITPPEPPSTRTVAGFLLAHLHPVPEINQNAIIAGMFCSRCLDNWGVQLQRAGELEKAARRFREAKRFNPDNIVADINLAFNEVLRTNQIGAPLAIDPARVTADQFGKYRNWNTLVTANGPVDDISFCFVNGYSLINENGFFRQAAVQYARVRQLAPDNLFTRLQLAQIYLFNRLPDLALEAIHDPLTGPGKFGLDKDNSTGLNILAAAAHFQKKEIPAGVSLLETEVARHPDDNTLLAAVTQSYFMNGLFTNALHIIDRKLARTPDDVTWLFGKGYASIQVGAYDDSVRAMTRVLEIETNNTSARFNRALACLQSGKLDEARVDYSALQSTYTNAFQIAYGLGEIAWRKKENAEALRNYQIYLANAPTNAPEFSTIRERVTQLRGK